MDTTKEDAQNTVTQKSETEFEVFSKSSNRAYRVWFGVVEELDGPRDNPDTVGSWHCSCPAGTFGRKCKHVKSALALFPQEEEGVNCDQL